MLDKIRKLVNDYRGGILYVIFGGFTTLINWGAYAVFVWLGIDVNISNVLSWICGVSFAFVANKWFVFSSRSTEAPTMIKEVSSFFGARILTGLVGIALFPVLYSLGMNNKFLGIDGFLAKIASSLAEIVLNWIFSKYFVFRKKAE